MRKCIANRWIATAVLVVLAGALVALSGLIDPASACAVSVSSSAKDHYRTADFTIELASTDPTGTVVLMVDGVTLEATSAVPGEKIALGEFALAVGSHQARAVLRTRDTVTESAALLVKVWPKPAAPKLVTPGEYAGATSSTAVKVGLATTGLSMYLNGTFVKTRAVVENTLAGMGNIALKKGKNTIKLVAANPIGTRTVEYTVIRTEWPWATCIVIDKSDYKLYWVKDGELVKTYPVAIGKASTPTPAATWRIDAKYYTDPSGVYGPRKMRLFRKTSSGYVFTAYGIHGTNQEWVIGTKASHGCIRMYNADVLELFPQVPLGTMVQTRE